MALENRFYKVSHNGGLFVTGLLFNPITKETESVVLADFDDDRIGVCSHWYDESIDDDARRAYWKHIGIVSAGDIVEVYKGRKIPRGTVAKVVRVYDWRDCYGRVQNTYAVFEDGRKTSVYNCRIVG